MKGDKKPRKPGGGASARIAATAKAKRVAAQYKRLPGADRRYENLKTGEKISRRQYEKLRHGGRTIESRAKDLRRQVVPLRQQKPRHGVLERLGGFLKDLATNVRASFSGLAKERKISPATIKRRAGRAHFPSGEVG